MHQTIENMEISGDQLERDLIQKIPILLFDLRMKEDFEQAHVEGSVHAICNAETKEKLMTKIPKNIKIVLISEPEDYAKETASMMKSFGLDAYFLDGGFSSWKGKVTKGQTGKIILPDELAQKLDSVFLLDVRDTDEFSEFQIPGSINIPLGELFNPETMSRIPKDKQVVTICPHGSRAMIASFALTRAGIDSQTLAGGLAGWNQVLKPVTIVEEPTKIIQVQKVGKGCLSHVVISDNQAVIIDPLYPFEKYIDISKQEAFQINGWKSI